MESIIPQEEIKPEKAVDQIICTNCRRPYPDMGAPFRCTFCGGVFDFVDDFFYSPDRVERKQPGIWRFRHTFGMLKSVRPISLGEGRTPLVSDRVEGREVFYKLEYLNPTGSFKDRSSSLILSFLHSRGIDEAVEDSSGNAGASFAAYAARAGIRGKVYVPDSAAGPGGIRQSGGRGGAWDAQAAHPEGRGSPAQDDPRPVALRTKGELEYNGRQRPPIVFDFPLRSR